MLIPRVTRLQAKDAGTICECCYVEPAELEIEHEMCWPLCADCAQQVARAFLEDVCALLPDEGKQP